jgi:hypothetical protein
MLCPIRIMTVLVDFRPLGQLVMENLITRFISEISPSDRSHDR